MSQLTLDLAAAVSAKEYGLDLVELANESFVRSMRKVAVQIAMKEGTVTSDRLRFLATAWGIAPAHCNAWGAVFNTKGWRMVDRQQSLVVSSHARWIGVWKWEGP